MICPNTFKCRSNLQLKLYTTHRLSVTDHGADSSLQGYSSYKKKLETNDFAVFEKEDIYKDHLYIMVFALISLVIACVILTSSKLCSSYGLLYIRSKKCKDESQRFRFKSLFWAVISTLVLIIITVVGLDFSEIHKFGTNQNSTFISIYILIIIGLVLSLVICVVISTLIVVRAIKKRGKLIVLPMILLCRRHQRQKFNLCQKIAIIFYQWIGSFAILFTSVVVSIHGTGIVIAALTNPLQVLSTVSTGVVGLFYLTYGFADIYDHYEDMFDVSPLPNCRSQVIFFIWFIFRVLTHVFVLLFYCLLSYIFLTDVIFISGSNIGLISSIANILPFILLTFLTWFSKHELQKFVMFESSSSSNDIPV